MAVLKLPVLPGLVPCSRSHCSIAVPCGGGECGFAHRGVVRTLTVEAECYITDSRIATAGGVGQERLGTHGRVGVAGSVAIERYTTDGRIVAAGRIEG